MCGRWGVYFHESHWWEGYITLCFGEGVKPNLVCHLRDSLCVAHEKDLIHTWPVWIKSKDFTNRSSLPATSNSGFICLLSKYCIGLTNFPLLCLVWDAFCMTSGICHHPPFCHCLHNVCHKWEHFARTKPENEVPFSDSSQRPISTSKSAGNCMGTYWGISPSMLSIVWSGN